MVVVEDAGVRVGVREREVGAASAEGLFCGESCARRYAVGRGGPQRRVHHAYGLVWREPRLWVRDFVAESLFAVGNSVGEHHPDGLVQVVPAFGRAADVQVDEVAERRPLWRSSCALFGVWYVWFDDGTG